MSDVYIFTAIIFALFFAVVLLITLRANKTNETPSVVEDEEDFQSMVTQINMANYSRLNGAN